MPNYSFLLSSLLSLKLLTKTRVYSMELFLEFVFTVSLSFVLSFVIAKLLSLSSSTVDRHLEAVSRSCMEVKTKPEKYIVECEKGFGFISEVVKVDALAESLEEMDHKLEEESLNGSHGGSTKVTEETTEEISCGEDETPEIEVTKEDEEDTEVLGSENENGGDCLEEEGLSDDDWEGIEKTELEKDFQSAVCFLESRRSNADQNFKLGNDVKLQLYGLHRIAIEGPCYEPQPMALKFSARAKWNAWKRLGNMSPEAAMDQYITLPSRTIPGWMQDDICGDNKQFSADVKASWKLPLDVETLPLDVETLPNRSANSFRLHVTTAKGLSMS